MVKEIKKKKINLRKPILRPRVRGSIKPMKFDPTDKAILRVLSAARLSATPSKIANTINIHPSTAKRRVQRLSRKGLVNLRSRGNRTLVKANKAAIRKRLKK